MTKKLIAKLRSAFIDVELSAVDANKIADAIEALQARVAELEKLLLAKQLANRSATTSLIEELGKVQAERDALAARNHHPETVFSNVEDEERAMHSRCDALAAELAAARAQEPTHPDWYQNPFSNCSFRLCDLPGQCRGEGKCHHPLPAAPEVK